MTRRTLIAGAPALLLHRALKAQRPTAHEPVGARYRIPTGPAARYNFHRLGQSLTEGATITGVVDDSGNGNDLSISTIQSARLPMYTNAAINGRGGFWPGSVKPSTWMVQTPDCAPTGVLVSPSFLNTNESAVSVLWCGQMGCTGSGQQNLFQVGQISCAHRDADSAWPKQLWWRNNTSSHGATAFSTHQVNCGPTCVGMVNGFGGSNFVTRFMVGRGRSTTGSINWTTATPITGPVYVGYSDFGGAGDPAGVIHHELVVYQLVLTEAELDLWQVYCNQIYGTPLARSTDTYVDRRVVFIGDSMLNGKNGVLGINMPSQVAKSLGNWSHVEYINYGVGSALISGHNTNIASLNSTYDGSLGAGHNIAVVWGYWNDFNANLTEAQLYTNITTLVNSLHATGFKVLVGTGLSGTGGAGVNGNGRLASDWLTTLNGLIKANTAAADGIIDTTPTGPDASFEPWCTAHISAHGDTATYTRWASVVAPQLAPWL